MIAVYLNRIAASLSAPGVGHRVALSLAAAFGYGLAAYYCRTARTESARADRAEALLAESRSTSMRTADM